MACVKNCVTDDVQVVFATANGIFIITVWDDAEVFIAFDDDQVSLNVKRDSVGDVYTAGHNYVVRPFTLTVPCTEEAVALDRAWRTNPVQMCGSLDMITGCCEDYKFQSLRMTAVNAPDVGTENGVYTFSFEGIVR